MNALIVAARSFIRRASKAIASAIAGASSTFGASLAADASIKAAAIAAAAGALGGLGLTYVAPANKESLTKAARQKIIDDRKRAVEHYAA